MLYYTGGSSEGKWSRRLLKQVKTVVGKEACLYQGALANLWFDDLFRYWEILRRPSCRVLVKGLRRIIRDDYVEPIVRLMEPGKSSNDNSADDMLPLWQEMELFCPAAGALRERFMRIRSGDPSVDKRKAIRELEHIALAC